MEAKIPPVLVAAATAGAMYAVAQWGPWPLNFDTGFNGRIGGALVIAGALIAVAGVVQFRRHGTTVDPLRPSRASTLVTTGIFRWTRNPMYLGILTALLGVGFWLGSGAALLLALAFAPLITVLQIRAEEHTMRVLFGDAFDDYAARVRRWL